LTKLASGLEHQHRRGWTRRCFDMLWPVGLGGHWAGWSCAYSVYGKPLALPPDLSSAQYGFQEIGHESVIDLQEPATGIFVDRETARLMPTGDPPQVRTGFLQVHRIGNGFVQDTHLEDDVWALQTVMATDDRRQRIGLLFDHGRGGLIQGIRIWQEQRFDPTMVQPRAGISALSERSHDSLTSEWLAATGGVGCFVDANTRAPPLSDTLSTGRVVLPEVGLTVRSARGMLVVEATDSDGRLTANRQLFVRTFDQGACYVRDGNAKPNLLRTVSARATTARSSRTRMSAAMATTYPPRDLALPSRRRLSQPLPVRAAALVVTACLLMPPLRPAAAAAATAASRGGLSGAPANPAVAAESLETELSRLFEDGAASVAAD